MLHSVIILLQESVGQNYNLIPPSTKQPKGKYYLTIKEIAEGISTFSSPQGPYPLELLPFDEWKTKLCQVPSSNPLYSAMMHYFPQDYPLFPSREYPSQHYNNNSTIEAIPFEHPSLQVSLIHNILGYFERKGILENDESLA